jgi:hypothetical protein
MMKPDADNANATLPEPQRARTEARPMILRTTGTARETTHR